MDEFRRLSRRALALGVIFLVVLVASVAVLRSQQPGAPRAVRGPRDIGLEGVYPSGTPSPQGFQPGIYIVRELYDKPAGTITPMAGVIGSHLEMYWSAIQPNLTATPDWRGVETQVAYAASQGRQVWLSLQQFQTNPTPNAPDVLSVPAGLPTVAYNGVGAGCAPTEYGPDYGATRYRNAVATVEAAMAAKFGSDSRIAGFALQIGASGEAWGVQDDPTCAKKAYFETPVPCQSYLDAVELAAKWLRQGTNKPISLASGVNPCSPSNSWMNEGRKATKRFFDDLNLTPTVMAPGTPAYIGYRYNGLLPDDAQSMYSTPTPGPYGHYQYGYSYPDKGGIFYETKLFAAAIPTADRQGFADYMVLNAASANAAAIFVQRDWPQYISPRVLNVIGQTLGTTAADAPLAWIWFRGAEYYTIADNASVKHSGYPEPFTHLARVTGAATPTTYCSPAVRATAQATGGTAPPNACQQLLNAPAAPESRNALSYAAGNIVGIDIADEWARGGAGNRDYLVSLRYLDNAAAGVITVAWRNAAGVESTYVVDLAGGGAWQTAEWTITAALNNRYTDHDLELRISGAAVLLNSLIVTAADAPATATPTNTPTATFTPTATRTPTPTFTPTATATPIYPAGVRFNEVNSAEGGDWNLSGDVNQADRYFELINWQPTTADLTGWSVTNGTTSYTLTGSISSRERKVWLAEDALNIPNSGTLTLRNAQATPVATVVYAAATPGRCYAAHPDASTTWLNNQPCSPGQVNP